MNHHLPRRPLGEILREQGLISEDQLRIVLQEQGLSGQPLGKLLVQLGFITEATLRDALSENLGKASIDLTHAAADPEALALIPQAMARRHHVLPLAYDGRQLTLAMASPDDLPTLDRIRGLLGPQVSMITFLAGTAEIDRAIDRYYGHELSIDGILREIETGEVDWCSLQIQDDEYSQPVVRLIDALLTDAVKQGASDIHFEPEAGFLRIRYRIDGVLRQIRVLHHSCWPAMVVRLKVLSGMNIAETRAPQDGHLSLAVNGHPVDFRAACQPTLHGENIVLRVLDRQKGIVSLDQLGLADEHLRQLQRMLARPEGIILVTGPTGSGKTTTLYSLLQHINSEHIHIMTLEDPVEYPLPLVRQTSVSEASRLDFANGIRAMMRQDPDVILVGEIRDRETAEMAFRAAMTGHQVFATLHSNSAVGALPRLLDIGIPAPILAGNIIGIIAQRLVRRLCLYCREEAPADPRECRLLGLSPNRLPPTLYHPRGCPHCKHLGYQGRLAIQELLRMDGEMDELTAQGASRREILAQARTQGFLSLAEDGARQVLAGTTSLEELGRVVDLTDRL